MKYLNVQERLALNKYRVDHEEPHITINREICSQCMLKPCTYVCPAGLYTLEGESISFDHAGCLECGACRVACDRRAIQWNYPRGTFGVIYRYG